MSVKQSIIAALGLAAISTAGSPAFAKDADFVTTETKVAKEVDPFAAQADPFTTDNDPFADEQDPFSNDDPFADSQSTENNIVDNNDTQHQSRIEVKSYYQNNNLREPHLLNPGIELF